MVSVSQPNAMGVPREPLERGTSEVLFGSMMIMNDNYSIEFDEWIAFEQERSRNHQSKEFIGDRAYRHLDARIPRTMLESNEAFKLIDTLTSPAKLQKHSFYPFLRKDKKVRRFTREYGADGTSRVKIDQKIRPIMYASHKDACIYGFYAYMLKEKYDKLIDNTALDKSIIAYRRIPRDDNSGRNKSNVDFSNDVYTAIKEKDECAVLCVDIKGFFDNMRHDNIRNTWSEVLGEDDLPVGHSIVYKNVTNYRYAFINEVLSKMGEGWIVKGRFRYSRTAKRRGMIGNPKLYNKLINNTLIIHKNRSIRGIPQGSPISDIIANMYLLNFDREMINFLNSKGRGNLYKRYSDDILIVCAQKDVTAVYQRIQQLMNHDSIDLNLSNKKTELFYVNVKSGILKDETALVEPGYIKNKKAIQYLGFEFDLSDLNIRSGTVASHYRKVAKLAKAKTVDNPKVDVKTKGPNSKKKKRNRYQYLKQAIRKTGSSRLKRQLRNIKHRTKTILK